MSCTPSVDIVPIQYGDYVEFADGNYGVNITGDTIKMTVQYTGSITLKFPFDTKVGDVIYWDRLRRKHTLEQTSIKFGVVTGIDYSNHSYVNLEM